VIKYEDNQWIDCKVTLDNTAFSSLLVLPCMDQNGQENHQIFIFGGLEFNKETKTHIKKSTSIGIVVDGTDDMQVENFDSADYFYDN